MRRTGAYRLCAILLPALLCGCAGEGISFLHPHGMVASAQRDWLIETTLWMMPIILPVLVLVPLIAWRYRRGNTRAAYRPKWEFSWPLEVAVWGLPMVVVGILAFLIVSRETPLGPYNPLPGKGAPLEVEVVALDWKWLFIYPDQHIATVGVLAIPEDRPIDFRLTSDATMQSFLIPSLGSQIYAMAGMVTQLHLIADRPGVLQGENTQFNGMHFQDEKFDVHVMPPQAFEQWTQAQSVCGRTLDATSYEQLAKRDTTEDARQRFGVAPSAPLSFAVTAPDLFGSIVGKYNPSAAQAVRSSSL